MNRDEIARYYADTWIKHVKFLMNKRKGGDGLTLKKEDAEDVLAATSLYHMESPSKFKKKYVYIKLIQMRIDFYRKQAAEKRYDTSYRAHLESEGKEYQEFSEPEASLLTREEHDLGFDIENIKNVSHREVVREYLQGKSQVTFNERKIVSRFKKRLKEKYNVDMDNGYRE